MTKSEQKQEITGFGQLPSLLKTAMVCVNLAAASGKWLSFQEGHDFELRLLCAMTQASGKWLSFQEGYGLRKKFKIGIGMILEGHDFELRLLCAEGE